LPIAQPEMEYRALGLSSRKTAFWVVIIGLFLSPALVGIPMVVWGAIADHMIYNHQNHNVRQRRW
jgi:hypothetical protein